MRFSNPEGTDRARETFQMGLYAARSADYDFALRLINESVERDADPMRLETLMLLYKALKMPAEAGRIAERLLRVDPDNAQARRIGSGQQNIP